MNLKKWEMAVVVAAGILFFGSLGAYLSGVPLRKYLFGIGAEEGQDLIGRVASASGTVRRELESTAEFDSIGKGDRLFRQDVVMTDDASSAVLRLDDGSTIELGPKSMVKLQTEAGFNLTGVSRTTRVEVVSGEVTGKTTRSRGAVILSSREGNIRLGRKASRTVRVAEESPDAILARVRSTGTAGTGLLSRLSFTALLQRVENSESIHPAGKSGTADESPKLTGTADHQEGATDNQSDGEPDFNFEDPPTPSPPDRPTPSPRPSPSPSPSPSPTPPPKPVRAQLVLLEPPPDATLTVPQGSLMAFVPVNFHWMISGLKSAFGRGACLKARLSVWALGSSPESRKPVFEGKLPCRAGVSQLKWAAIAPGTYEWRVALDRAEGKARFIVKPDFEAIEVSRPESLKPSDSPATESWMERSKPRVRLTWSPYPTATEYEISIANPAPDMKASVLTRETTHVFTRSSILDTKLTYEIISHLPSGFIVHSPRTDLSFDFNPPDPVSPADRTTLSKSVDGWTDNGVLLTWQKIGISEGYQLEIARDSSFRQVIINRSQKDNFFLFRPPHVNASYWWRIRAFAGRQFTQPSEAFRFNISTR